MKNIAFIFPGQGSQACGMGLDLYNNFKSAKETFDRADEILGKKISAICFGEDEAELKKTINAQSAIVTTSLAALRAFFEITEGKIEPKMTAGHSLGEYCALNLAGVMDFETTLLAIQKRSELMDLATKEKSGTMSAILGLEPVEIQKCLDEVQNLGVAQIANYNNKGQTVITGEIEAIKKAGELIKNAGARRVVPLPVSGAFHSELMQSATESFVDFVKELKLSNAKIPVITNTDAAETTLAQDFRQKMPKQISSSVLWYQGIELMLNKGIDTFVEFGQGGILCGLNKKICPPDVKTYNVFDKNSLEETIKEIL